MSHLNRAASPLRQPSDSAALTAATLAAAAPRSGSPQRAATPRSRPGSRPGRSSPLSPHSQRSRSTTPSMSSPLRPGSSESQSEADRPQLIAAEPPQPPAASRVSAFTGNSSPLRSPRALQPLRSPTFEDLAKVGAPGQPASSSPLSKAREMRITVLSADGLADPQILMRQDPYVRATYMKTMSQAQTEYVWGGGASPVWDETHENCLVLDLRCKHALTLSSDEAAPVEYAKCKTFPNSVLLEVFNSNVVFDDRVGCAILNFSDQRDLAWVEHPRGGKPGKHKPANVSDEPFMVDLTEPTEVAIARAGLQLTDITPGARGGGKSPTRATSPRSRPAGTLTIAVKFVE